MATNDTETRLGELEREARILRRHVRMLTYGLGLTLLFVVSTAGVWWLERQRAAAAVPGELRATRLLITDPAGRTRAELGFPAGTQEPHLVLLHPDGRRWAALAVEPPPGASGKPAEAGFFLHDTAGKARLALSASEQDSGLVVYDAQGTPGLALFSSPERQGLAIFDGKAPRIHLRYDQHDDAQLSELLFRDEQKKDQAVLRAGRGGVSFTLDEGEGKGTFKAP